MWRILHHQQTSNIVPILILILFPPQFSGCHVGISKKRELMYAEVFNGMKFGTSFTKTSPLMSLMSAAESGVKKQSYAIPLELKVECSFAVIFCVVMLLPEPWQMWQNVPPFSTYEPVLQLPSVTRVWRINSLQCHTKFVCPLWLWQTQQFIKQVQNALL